MFVKAIEPSGGSPLYFRVNFAPQEGHEYVFMWPDGTRKTMAVALLDSRPDSGDVPLATFDVASHEVIVHPNR